MTNEDYAILAEGLGLLVLAFVFSWYGLPIIFGLIEDYCLNPLIAMVSKKARERRDEGWYGLGFTEKPLITRTAWKWMAQSEDTHRAKKRGFDIINNKIYLITRLGTTEEKKAKILCRAKKELQFMR